MTSALLRTTCVLLSTCFVVDVALAQTGEPFELWRTTITPASNHSALDSQGNLVVSGAGPSLSMRTTKIAPNGAVLWTRDYDLPGSDPKPVWIAVDSQDNVIHGAYAEGASGGPTGLLAVKYAPDGTFLWSSFGSSRGQARRLAVDELDDVYIFGEVWGGLSGFEPTGNDFLTVKIAADGTPLWQRTANGTGSDEPYGLDVGGGIVAVTGHASSPFMTVAYDYDGNELWQEFYADGIFGATDVVVGPTAEVVVCGWGTTFGALPYVGTVVKYDSAGNEVWRVLHNGTGGLDNMRRLAIDDDGAVAAVGFDDDGWVTWKIDADGELLWARYFDGTSQPYTETATLPVFGSRGEVYVVGKGGPSCTGVGLESYVLKYAPDGAQEWTLPLPCSYFAHSMNLDAAGNLMIGTTGEAIRVRERPRRIPRRFAVSDSLRQP